MLQQAEPIPELSAIDQAVARAKTSDPKGWSELSQLKSWEIYTDGSAPIINPGGAIGFSAVFILGQDKAWEVFGGVPGRTTEPATSNNRAEISGALTILEVLYSLKKENATLPESVMIVCDSQYVVNCAQGKWKKHKNKDLWKRYDQLMCVARQSKVKLDYRWTRAHVGTKWNERADVLAKDGAYLAIGKNPDSVELAEAPREVKAIPECGYLLQLYSEMTGKSSAKGTYRLASPKKERQAVVDVKNVITLDEAEYHLLLDGLTDLLSTLDLADRNPEDFKVLIESSRELMLKQLQGQYGVKSERLQVLHRKATPLTKKFASVEWLQSKKVELKEALRSW